METERDRIRHERAMVRQRYGTLFETVAAILFKADPKGISFETNTDEYEAETGTILPRLGSASSVQDVARIVHGEFARWFGDDEAGAPESYQAVAAEIWEAWRAFDQRE